MTLLLCEMGGIRQSVVDHRTRANTQTPAIQLQTLFGYYSPFPLSSCVISDQPR